MVNVARPASDPAPRVGTRCLFAPRVFTIFDPVCTRHVSDENVAPQYTENGCRHPFVPRVRSAGAGIGRAGMATASAIFRRVTLGGTRWGVGRLGSCPANEARCNS